MVNEAYHSFALFANFMEASNQPIGDAKCLVNTFLVNALKISQDSGEQFQYNMNSILSRKGRDLLTTVTILEIPLNCY